MIDERHLWWYRQHRNRYIIAKDRSLTWYSQPDRGWTHSLAMPDPQSMWHQAPRSRQGDPKWAMDRSVDDEYFFHRCLWRGVQSGWNKLSQTLCQPHRKAQLHNLVNSALHNLPTELLLRITSSLGPLSRSSMQRVCSRFRACLGLRVGEFKHQFVYERGVRQFTVLLHRDRQLALQQKYAKMCESKWSRCSRLGCSGCRATHKARFFSTGQLALPPQLRVCQGLEGHVRMCDHFSFSAQCLLVGLGEFRHLSLVCDKHRQHQNTSPSLAFIGGQVITVNRRIPIMKVEMGHGSKTTDAALAAALRAIDSYVCPHSRTSSPALFGGLRLADDSNETYWSYRDLPMPPHAEYCSTWYQDFGVRSGRCIVWSDCVNPHCHTRYGLRREKGYSDGSVWAVLEVARDLVGGPTHPSWLAQLEPDDGGGSASCRMCSRQCCVDGYHNLIMDA